MGDLVTIGCVLLFGMALGANSDLSINAIANQPAQRTGFEVVVKLPGDFGVREPGFQYAVDSESRLIDERGRVLHFAKLEDFKDQEFVRISLNLIDQRAVSAASLGGLLQEIRRRTHDGKNRVQVIITLTRE